MASEGMQRNQLKWRGMREAKMESSGGGNGAAKMKYKRYLQGHTTCRLMNVGQSSASSGETHAYVRIACQRRARASPKKIAKIQVE